MTSHQASGIPPTMGLISLRVRWGFGLSLLGFWAFLQVARADDSELKDLMSEVRPALQSMIKTTSRPVVLYHWTNRSSVGVPLKGVVDSQDPLYFNYVKGATQGFFRFQKKSRDMLGNGLYLAVDPVATRRYGAQGATWVLLALEVKKGARFLDLAGRMNSIPADLANRLAAYGCGVTSWQDVFARADGSSSGTTWGKTVDGKKCQAVKAALANDPALGIFAARYSYSATSYKDCGPRGYAFNAWNSNGFDSKSSFGLSAGLAPVNSKAATAQRLLRALFEAPVAWGDRAAATAQNIPLNQWPYSELSGKASAQEVEEFKRERLLGCSSVYSEDRAN